MNEHIKYHRTLFFIFIQLISKFQISRILLKPINITEVIVKAASRKPK